MSPVAICGRESELELFRDLIRRSLAGLGGAVWLTGEPGIGKSALLDVVAAECAQAGIRVLRATAEEMESRLPFAVIGSWLRAGSGPPQDEIARVGLLLRMSAGPQDATAVGRDFLIAEALLDLLEQWCVTGPVVLMLDDAQWADNASLLALRRLALEAGHLPLLLVLARRPVPPNEELEQLQHSLESRDAVAVSLGPLAATEVDQLVELLVGLPPSPQLARLVAGAAGNPLYVSELVAALLRDERIAVADGVAQVVADDLPYDSVSAALPQSLTAAILRRLDFLSRPARAVLQVAAMLGPGVNVPELSVVLGRPPAELQEAIDDAAAAGLLIGHGRELVFRHDLIRQAMIEDSPATMRDGLRIQAAHALADSGAQVERVARYLSGDIALDARAIDWLVGSAEQLVAQAPAQAVDLLERALAALEPDDIRAPVLRYQQIRALLWAGEPVRAEKAARTALAFGRGQVRDIDFRFLLVQACFQQGELKQAIAEAERASTSVGLTAVEAARFEFFAAHCRFIRGSLDPAEESVAQAMAGSGDESIRACGLSYLGSVYYMQGRFAEALDQIDQARTAFEDQESMPEWGSGMALNRAYCLVELDRPAEAVQAYEASWQRAEQHGSVYLPWYHLGTARLHFLLGRWDDALAEVKAGLSTVESLGRTRALHSDRGLHGQAALIAVHRGDLGTCLAMLRLSGTHGRHAFYDCTRLWAEALAHEAAGRPEEAHALLFAAWDKAPALRLQRGLHYLCPDMSRLSVTLADTQGAQRLAAEVESLAARQPAPSMRATAALCRALAESDLDLLYEAGRAFAEAGRPLYQAYAAENAADLLADAGRPAEARDLLNTAVDLYDRLEAGWDGARAESRLRRRNVRRSRRRGLPRPKIGWEALTDTELRVAALVAEGHSNPNIAAQLFISRRTVQSHVSSILAKLALTSRVELAVLAHRRNHG